MVHRPHGQATPGVGVLSVTVQFLTNAVGESRSNAIPPGPRPGSPASLQLDPTHNINLHRKPLRKNRQIFDSIGEVAADREGGPPARVRRRPRNLRIPGRWPRGRSRARTRRWQPRATSTIAPPGRITVHAAGRWGHADTTRLESGTAVKTLRAISPPRVTDRAAGINYRLRRFARRQDRARPGSLPSVPWGSNGRASGPPRTPPFRIGPIGAPGSSASRPPRDWTGTSFATAGPGSLPPRVSTGFLVDRGRGNLVHGSNPERRFPADSWARPCQHPRTASSPATALRTALGPASRPAGDSGGSQPGSRTSSGGSGLDPSALRFQFIRVILGFPRRSPFQIRRSIGPPTVAALRGSRTWGPNPGHS